MISRGMWSICLSIGVAAVAPSSAVAQSDLPWCAIDDPATWRQERLRVATEGADANQINCKPKVTGATLPMELTLPLPCDRAMIFRRVDVPLPHPLDHLIGNFGSVVDIERESPTRVLSSGAWSAPVGGAFTLGGDSNGLTTSYESFQGKAYYIAKYELTEAQWLLFSLGALDPGLDAVERDAICARHDAALADLDPRHVLAKVGLSWFDGVDYSRAYSNWLVAEDRERIAADVPPALPWEQGATGYLRLPSEAEWEFAARGGAAGVTPQAQPRTIPLAYKEDTGEIGPAALSEVCADEPNPDRGWIVGGVGRKAPNAFQIYDMLCNAEEIVLDLFRPTRPDGLHGQVGGIVTKGGNSFSLREESTVGRRLEAQALFTTRGEERVYAGGTRLAISAPVFPGRRTNQNDYVEGRGNQLMFDAFMDSRAQLLERGLTRGGTAALNREIEQLRKQMEDGQLSSTQLSEQVAALQTTVDQLTTELAAQAALSVRTGIRGAVATSLMIDRVGVNLYDAYARLDALAEEELDGALTADAVARIRATVEAGIPRNQQRIRAGFDLYVQLLREIGEEDPAFVEQQLAAAKAGASGADVRVFDQFLDFFEIHHKQMRAERGRVTERMLEDWIGQIDSYQSRRIAEYAEYELR